MTMEGSTGRKEGTSMCLLWRELWEKRLGGVFERERNIMEGK